MKTLTKESQFVAENRIFSAHQATWERDNLGQFVVIKGEDILGLFPSLQAAHTAASKKYGLSPYLLRHIVPPRRVNVTFLGKRMSAS